jgi:hypothetical protein
VDFLSKDIRDAEESEGSSKKLASRYQSLQLKFSSRRPFSRFSAHFVNTVHIHERLSASTDFSSVRPEVASDNRGLGRARIGIPEDEKFGLSCGSIVEVWESLRWIPSTNARNLSSGGDGNNPLGDSMLTSNAVGRDKSENRIVGVERRFY